MGSYFSEKATFRVKCTFSTKSYTKMRDINISKKKIRRVNSVFITLLLQLKKDLSLYTATFNFLNYSPLPPSPKKKEKKREREERKIRTRKIFKKFLKL